MKRILGLVLIICLAGCEGALLRTFGADRLMWATDSPWILEEPGYENLTRVIDAQLPDLSEEQRALIMGGTARARLFSRG